jgi:dienelactone hydrolase
MARRLASGGYYVLLPNLYYRAGVMEIGPIPPDPDHPARKQMFALMNSLDIDLVMSDAEGLLAYAGADPAADDSRVGSVGYCMSGRYAVSLAVRRPEITQLLEPMPSPTPKPANDGNADSRAASSSRPLCAVAAAAPGLTWAASWTA